jgi:hypothetical protein
MLGTSQSRLGGTLMIWVAGNAALVEYKQQVSSDAVGNLEDMQGQHVKSLSHQSPVRVVEEFYITDA